MNEKKIRQIPGPLSRQRAGRAADVDDVVRVISL